MITKAGMLICDDVRQEVGGKVSLMGLFREAGVADFPAVLPKFFVVLFLRGSKGSCELKLELVAPSGGAQSLWSKKVELRDAALESVEVIGLWNLKLTEAGSHRLVLSGEDGPVEESSLEVAKAHR